MPIKGQGRTYAYILAHVGHEGCINPNHLAWKTQKENLQDCRRHGTIVRNRGGNYRRFSPDQVQAIKDARGTVTQVKLAETYGTTAATISDIWRGKSYTKPLRIKHWTPADESELRDALARGMSFREAANHLGKPMSGVMGKTYRLGLKSGQPATREYPPRLRMT